MPSKCPPGVVCIENITLIVSIIIISLIIGLFLYKSPATPIITYPSPDIVRTPVAPQRTSPSVIQPPIQISKMPVSTHLVSTPHQGIGIPVNIPTQPGNYYGTPTQVGILSGNGEILPLMGKQLISGRDTWNYYTISNQRTQVQLPISYRGKSCTSEYGCDSLSSGDMVYVEGYDQVFDVTMYDKQPLRYIPL